MVVCYACGKSNDPGERVGRRDTCTHCGADLHVCYNCEYYDAQAYNECREVQAERVLEKDRANFCDYFSTSQGKPKGPTQQSDAKKKLDALFKK